MKLKQSISFVRKVNTRPRIFKIGIFIHLLVLSALSNPVVIPTPTEQAVDYHYISNIVWGCNKLLSLMLLIGFLMFGVGNWISKQLLNYSKYSTLVIISTIFFILNWLVQLPLERIRSSSRNQLVNIPNLPILQWIINQFLESLLVIIFSILVTLFVYWLINKSPNKCWLWATGAFSFLFLVFLVAEPYSIPQQPLGLSHTEVKISELAEQIGIPKDSIVLENCEPFEKCEIAHVSGVGPTRLILLNKGLFQNYPEKWTIQTFAHESKHFVKDDNLSGWFVFTFILSVGFWLLDRISRSIIQRFSNPLGFNSIAQPAALPLMILILNVMFLIALPPINIFRQQIEFEADRYGLEITHQNQALAEMVSNWTTLSKLRVPNPSLFFMLFRSSHPSDATRISFANEFQGKDKKE